MRAELVVGLLLLLASQGRAGLLAEAAGPMHLGDGGAEASSDPEVSALPLRGREFELNFELAGPVKDLRVSIDRVAGLQSVDESSPGVFLDDLYLGPVRKEHNGNRWISPFKADLSAGKHRVSLLCPETAADDFVWQGLKVYTGGLPKTGPAKALPQRADTALNEADCGEMRLLAWPLRLKNRALQLSVLGGRELYSGALARLEPGTAFLGRFKVPRAPEGQAQPPLLLHWGVDDEFVRLRFAVDEEAKPKGNEPLGYAPGAWEPLEIRWCPGATHLRFKVGTQELQLEAPPDARQLNISARGIELGLDKAR